MGIKHKVSRCSTGAHLALWLAIVMGAKPIVFVAQDLAYTSETSSHAGGAIFSAAHSIPRNYRATVTGIHGNSLPTHRGYIEFKTVFEEIIKEYPGVYLNGSENGAHIQGTRVVPLDRIIKDYLDKPLDGMGIIKTSLTLSDDRNVVCLLDKCKEKISEIENKIAWVKKTLKQVAQIKEAINKSASMLKDVSHPDQLPNHINRMIVELNQYKVQSERLGYTEEMFYQVVLEIDRRLAKNKDIFSKAYIDGVDDMLDIMRFENQSYLSTLDRYQAMVSGLSDHLIREGSLLREINNANGPASGTIALARLYHDSEDFLLARQVVDKLGDDENALPGVLNLKGRIHAGQLDFDQALLYWEQSVAADPGLVDDITEYRKKIALGWLQKVIGNFGPLKEWVRRFVALAPDNDWALRAISDMWKKDSDRIRQHIESESTTKLLDKWSPCQSIVPEWHYLKAWCLYAHGEHEKALPCAMQAVSMEAGHGDWMMLFARVLIENHRFDEGIKQLKEAVQLLE